MNRADRRSQARHERATRVRSRRKAARRNDMTERNPVAQAAMRARINTELRHLRTRAGLHAYTGGDAGAVVDATGRLIYVVAYAAAMHGLEHTPEASVLRGCANALADVAATPAALEAQRSAIISGLAAAERLMPHLHTWALAAGALELDALLHRGHLTTGSIDHLLSGGHRA